MKGIRGAFKFEEDSFAGAVLGNAQDSMCHLAVRGLPPGASATVWFGWWSRETSTVTAELGSKLEGYK